MLPDLSFEPQPTASRSPIAYSYTRSFPDPVNRLKLLVQVICNVIRGKSLGMVHCFRKGKISFPWRQGSDARMSPAGCFACSAVFVPRLSLLLFPLDSSSHPAGTFVRAIDPGCFDHDKTNQRSVAHVPPQNPTAAVLAYRLEKNGGRHRAIRIRGMHR